MLKNEVAWRQKLAENAKQKLKLDSPELAQINRGEDLSHLQRCHGHPQVEGTSKNEYGHLKTLSLNHEVLLTQLTERSDFAVEMSQNQNKDRSRRAKLHQV